MWQLVPVHQCFPIWPLHLPVSLVRWRVRYSRCQRNWDANEPRNPSLIFSFQCARLSLYGKNENRCQYTHTHAHIHSPNRVAYGKGGMRVTQNHFHFNSEASGSMTDFLLAVRLGSAASRLSPPSPSRHCRRRSGVISALKKGSPLLFQPR